MKTVFNEITNNILISNVLTIGKSYDVIAETRFDELHTKGHIYPEILCYIILCDDGVERELLRNKFISIEEHRDRIINKILR